MTEATLTDIVVCTTCRPAGIPREQTAPGQLLHDAVQAALQAQAADLAEAGAAVPAMRQSPRLRGLACMSGCDRACTVALQAPGKFSYYFGDLSADAETAAQLITCAQLHQASGDGTLLRNARPERLRSGILARLPPVSPAVERTAAMAAEAR
jgi:predicted metal-binding protein